MYGYFVTLSFPAPVRITAVYGGYGAKDVSPDTDTADVTLKLCADNSCAGRTDLEIDASGSGGRLEVQGSRLTPLGLGESSSGLMEVGVYCETDEERRSRERIQHTPPSKPSPLPPLPPPPRPSPPPALLYRDIDPKFTQTYDEVTPEPPPPLPPPAESLYELMTADPGAAGVAASAATAAIERAAASSSGGGQPSAGARPPITGAAAPVGEHKWGTTAIEFGGLAVWLLGSLAMWQLYSWRLEKYTCRQQASGAARHAGGGGGKPRKGGGVANSSKRAGGSTASSITSSVSKGGGKARYGVLEQVEDDDDDDVDTLIRKAGIHTAASSSVYTCD